jgi:uncharacterized damage-inducible protein DinB
MPISKPPVTEYPPYYHTYIGKVTHNNLVEALKESSRDFISFLQSIPAEKHNYKYAEGKWTIKEIVGHIIDGERVFMYRALRFSRNDATPLPGFDENEWTPQSNAANRSMESLMEEYETVRKSSIAFFNGITDEMSKRKGKANGHDITVRALGYILPGHEMHHMQVIKERYL